MIDVRPYGATAAWAVLSRLDGADQAEVAACHGRAVAPLEIFAQWDIAQRGALLSVILHHGTSGTPFAVLAVIPSGLPGQAQAAFLARDHRSWRRPIAAAARIVRTTLPGFCDDHALTRIECRCWSGHPTAPRFLTLLGFMREATLAGFGAEGRETFHQFALTRKGP